MRENSLIHLCITNKIYKHLFEESNYAFLAYSNSSIYNFLTEFYKTNAHLAAIIYGGRCNNEKPAEFIINHTVDIDISSAYGTSLVQFDYPLGNPTIFTQTHNENPITLGQFLQNHRNELIPSLYTIYVSGTLDFRQDLLYSKDVSFDQLNRITCAINKRGQLDYESSKELGYNDRDDSAHIYSDMILSRKELLHAVITSDLLEILEKVSTANEYQSIMGLKVETAVYYAKQHRLEDVQTWSEHVLKDKGTLSYDLEKQTPVDTRTRAWVSLPLSHFLGRLLEKKA